MKNFFSFYLFIFASILTDPLSAATIIQATYLQMGDNIMAYCAAKILSIQYNLPFHYEAFKHSDLFILSSNETLLKDNLSSGKKRILVRTEADIMNNKDQDVYLLVPSGVWINTIEEDSLKILKNQLQLKDPPTIDKFNQETITIAVHIRKGNGGGEVLDGEPVSLQAFDYDRFLTQYITHYSNYPFDLDIQQRPLTPLNHSEINWHQYLQESCHHIDPTSISKREVKRLKRGSPPDKIWITRFLPNQFYVDHIRMLSHYLHDAPLTVQIFTDDKDPHTLVKDIKEAVNKPNISFHYEHHRHLSYKEQMKRDLLMMSQSDILLRSQSQFARTAQLMGHHKLIIYPLECRWESNDRLIPIKVVIKGSL